MEEPPFLFQFLHILAREELPHFTAGEGRALGDNVTQPQVQASELLGHVQATVKERSSLVRVGTLLLTSWQSWGRSLPAFLGDGDGASAAPWQSLAL